MFQLTIWSIPPLFAALVTATAYRHARGLKEVPGLSAFRLLLAAVLLWCGAGFLDSITTSFASKVLIQKLTACAIIIAPVAWFTFAVTFAGRQTKVSTLAMNVVAVIPMVSMVLAMSNPWHQLMWNDFSLVHFGGYVALQADVGLGFLIGAGYSLILIVVATSILAFTLFQAGQSWKPCVAVIAAPVLVIAGNAYTVSPLNLTPWFDVTTLAWALAMLLLDVGVLRYGLLESNAVIRDRVVEQLNEGVVVIHPTGEIIDANSAAVQILQTTREEITQTHIETYVQTIPLTKLNSRQRNNVGITLNKKAYDVTSAALDPTTTDTDIVLVFRDVTDRREEQQRLQTLKSELEEMAHTDALTGLTNRRLFISRLNEEVERVRRHGSTLSVLIFDLDHFKKINDTYGHDVGDRVLVAVSKATTRIKRITDVAARIGGEEFALLLPETNSEGALNLAGRLREAIEEIETFTSNGHPVPATASVGVATVTQENRQLEEVLKLADNALYLAKNSGRNRVCSA